MVSLDEKTAIDLIQNPKHQKALTRAKLHESRVRFHSEIYLDADDCAARNQYHKKYHERVANILLLEGKIDLFKSLLLYPFATQGVIVEKIMSAHEKVFKAQDAYVEYGFNNSEFNDDFAAYLDTIKEPLFWKEEGFECRYGHVSKIWVVDLPMNAPMTGRANPYFYTVDVDQIRDVKHTKEGFEYIIINQDTVEEVERVLFIDSLAWRVFKKDKTKEWELETEAVHGLGFCPSDFVVGTPLDSDGIARFSPLSPVLGLLDRYLDKFTFKDHYELYAAFALYWFFDFEKPEQEPTIVQDGDQALQLTPINKTSAQKRGKLGPGLFLEVPAPASKEDADLRSPIGKVDADAGSLDYNQKELVRSQEEILKTVTEKLETLTKEAVNEKQVASNTDGEEAILMWLGGDIARSRKKLIDTLGKLRYGVNYSGCTVSGGTKFGVGDTATAVDTFGKIKLAGLPQYVVNASLQKVEYTLTQDTPTLEKKTAITSILEPLPTQTPMEVITLFTQGIVDEATMKVKLYFFDLVTQFENENGSIEMFLPELDFKTRITIIKKIFNDYAGQRVVKLVKPEQQNGKTTSAAA